MAEQKKRKLPISIFELVVYILSGLMGLWGLTYIILGIVANHISYKSSLYVTNAAIAANTGGMGFLYQGILILAIAIAVAVIVLLANAKNSDKEYEKQQRRIAAKNARMQMKQQVVDAEVSEKPAE